MNIKLGYITMVTRWIIFNVFIDDLFDFLEFKVLEKLYFSTVLPKNNQVFDGRYEVYHSISIDCTNLDENVVNW